MSKNSKTDHQAHLKELESLYRQGKITEEFYQAAKAGLKAEEPTTFDQKQQRVDRQINIGKGVFQYGRDRLTSPEALRQAYLNRLAQQSYRLPLSGVDPKAAADDGSQELQLSAVYTALMTQRQEAEGDFIKRQMKGRMEKETLRLSALETLNQEGKLALLGDPGSGKSTFVNYVGLCMAGEALGDSEVNLSLLTSSLPKDEKTDRYEDEKEPRFQSWDHGVLLPVRIVLRDFAARGLPDAGQPAGGGTVWKFIVEELGETLKEYAAHLKKTLQEQGGLILLDGLDEVPDADKRRVQVKQAVQGFASDFPRCRFLVTSRTYAYQSQEWKLDGFTEAVLSPFTPGQITRFVDRWYAHIAVVRDLRQDDARGRATILKSAIDGSPRLKELATRPLLLTLMASLHAWRGGSLPEKREELYHDAVDLLLDQWESPKVVCDVDGCPVVQQSSLAQWMDVDRSVVRTELNRLAFEAHRDQPELVGTADIAEERLVAALMRVARSTEVNPNQIVTYIWDRAGFLAARAEGIYTFPHRTFQEYLAACHLTDYGFPDEPAALLKADPQRWHEAVLLAGAKASRGTATSAWNLAEALCHAKLPRKNRKKMPEPECWGALLAAQTLLENETERLDQVAEQNKPKLERIRRWLLAIVQRGWLPPVDRALAGKALSVMGDDRDFDELVPIPGGPFIMGNDDEEDTSPQHEIIIPAFKIGRYPVTNAQYRRFVEDTNRDWRSGKWWDQMHANCPAVAMTWHDARAYCAWQTERWHKEGKITPEEEVRLLTEAEWEKAARGKDGRVFPWGDKWEEIRCNTREAGIGDTCAVGMYPNGASSYGCLDMAGNVWEWTSSLWGKSWGKFDYRYPYVPGDGREHLEAGDEVLRVLRGGSWLSNQNFARCSCSFRGAPNYGDDLIGFRVLVSPVSAL